MTETPIKIHPAGLAVLNAPNAGQRYEPSNGSEGEAFWSSWCSQCERDRALNGSLSPGEFETDEDHCRILNDSMMDGGVAEWIFGDDGQPKCTAFVPMGEKIPPGRDDQTIDMFGEPA